ncbi:hypothetical protein TruAng_009489 [Truncatella angustata]|nr:hypothetical protein TruAng_009489 [Truncatella angustata]
MASIRCLRVSQTLSKSSIRPARCTRTTAAAAPLTQRRYKSGPYGYTQAKSLVFSKFGEPDDVLSPSLPSSSLLLRALAAPINPADVNTIQGTYGVKPAFSPLIGTSEPSVIPGNEGVFEVLSGSSSNELGDIKKGDWVIPAKTGFGTWRTHAVAEAGSVLRVDRDGLTPTQAGTVAVNPCSAYRMLRDYADPPLREGDWFIQNGANSGVGRAAIQLGRLWGYRSINVVRGRDTPEETEKLRRELKELGADHVVTEEEFLSREFRDQVKEWTRGGREGIQLGLNCVGGKSAQNMAKNLGANASLVTYGGMSRQPVVLPTGLLIFKNIKFLGFWLSRWADQNTADKQRTVNEILGLVREGKFRDTPVVDVKWDWDTEESTLREAVQGTLQGFRQGKGVFVFGET